MDGNALHMYLFFCTTELMRSYTPKLGVTWLLHASVGAFTSTSSGSLEVKSDQLRKRMILAQR